jgi:hypothetical protein
MDDELAKAYEKELALSEAKRNEANLNSYTTMFANQPKQNLIEWELDFRSELEDIERLLRCDILKRDKNNNEFWSPNPNKERIVFNDLGVNDILRVIVTIVNKGKALSNYEPEEINKRVKQFKHELRVLVYNNYEMYGIDNDYKMNNYSVIILAVGSIVEDVYKRAMGGETHKGLAEQRLVTQSDPIQRQSYPMPTVPQKKKLYNPFTWFK